MKADLLTAFWQQRGRRPELSPIEWEHLLGQARQARLLARLAHHCAAQGWMPDLPPGPRAYLQGALRMADRQRHEVRWEVRCIQRALVNTGVAIVLLKGAAYMMAGLPAAEGRIFADIDVMVARESIGAAEDALFAGGWMGDERDPYNQRYYREWMHEIPPLRHVTRNTYIDLHHTIAPPTSRFKVDGASLLARAVPVASEPDVHVLAPTDMVLHSACHLFQEGEFGSGLRDLLDLDDLLQHFGADAAFWPALLQRSRELGLQVPLHHALFHVGRLFGTEPPAELRPQVDALGSSALARWAMSHLLTTALRPMHPTCDTAWTPMARWLLYVRSHALRMPLHLALPHLARKAWMRRFPKEVAQPEAGRASAADA